MKLNADVDVSSVIQKLADAGGQVQDGIVKFLNEEAKIIEGKAKQRAPKNNTILASSIQAELVSDKSKPQVFVEVNAYYGPFVEFGTKSKEDIPQGLQSVARQWKSQAAKKGGGNFGDLLKNIKQWCKNKGIESEAAYPIAVKIAREGVGAQPFLFPAYFSEIPKIEKGIAKLLKSIK